MRAEPRRTDLVLRNLARIVLSVNEFFALGRRAAHGNCLGCRRLHRRARTARGSLEGYFRMVVARKHVREGGAEVISDQQFKTVASLAVRRQLSYFRCDDARLNAAARAMSELQFNRHVV